jgi:IS5 family transposase
VRKRSQLATKIEGEDTWTKRSKLTGEFMSQKKAPAKKKYKGVRAEK